MWNQLCDPITQVLRALQHLEDQNIRDSVMQHMSILHNPLLSNQGILPTPQASQPQFEQILGLPIGHQLTIMLQQFRMPKPLTLTMNS